MLGRMGARGGFGRMGIVGGLTAHIALSSATIIDTAAIGTTIGTLSVEGATGSFTFSLTSNPGSLFSISGSSLQVAGTLTTGVDAITIQAVSSSKTLTASFLIVVTGYVPTYYFLGF